MKVFLPFRKKKKKKLKKMIYDFVQLEGQSGYKLDCSLGYNFY